MRKKKPGEDNKVDDDERSAAFKQAAQSAITGSPERVYTGRSEGLYLKQLEFFD